MIVQGNFLQRRFKSYQRNIMKEYFMNKEVGVLLGDRGGGGVSPVLKHPWTNLLIYAVATI